MERLEAFPKREVPSLFLIYTADNVRVKTIAKGCVMGLVVCPYGSETAVVSATPTPVERGPVRSIEVTI